MATAISIEDVEGLRKVLMRLREFRDEWEAREDDAEEMWTEAPEMATVLVAEMEPILARLDAPK